jgi:hypothetical protein
MSHNRAKADFEAIEALRDAVAHIGDYALSQEAADRTIDTVGLTRFWIEALRRLETNPAAARLQVAGDDRPLTSPGRSGDPLRHRPRPRS